MSRIGITITKRTAFRDSTQEFSNTYYYDDGNPLAPTESVALGLIDELTANEKTFHSSAVTFVRGKCWTAGGTPAQNNMIAEKLLTGTGASITATGFDKERAVLIQWPAGVDSRGHEVTLKKWYHCCGNFAATSFASGQMANETSIASGARTDIANAADVVTRIGNAEGWGLVSKSGRQRDGGAPRAHKYLEHHQLGDQWR